MYRLLSYPLTEDAPVWPGNPIATIWAGAMMLEFQGESATATAVMTGINGVLQGGQILTPDRGGSATTAEMGDANCSNIL